MRRGARRRHRAGRRRAWPGRRSAPASWRGRSRRSVRRDAVGARARARRPTPASGCSRRGMADVEALAAAAREHDVVIAQELPPVVLERRRARAGAARRRPLQPDRRRGARGRRGAAARRAPPDPRADRRAHARRCCAAADLVLCANERQRDLWIGGMALHGLLDPDAYARDPTLRSRVDGRAVRAARRARRRRPRARCGARSPRSAPDDRVLVWGGGVWGWLDPVTPIARGRAAGRAPTSCCSASAGPGWRRRARRRRARRPSRRRAARGLLGTRVHVNDGWVPYAERGAWLAEADLGRQRAPRPRRGALRPPHAAARLPVGRACRSSTTRGDALAELVERERARRAWPRPGDVAGLRRGLRADARARGRRRPRADRRRRAGAALGARSPRRSPPGAPRRRRAGRVRRGAVRRAALGAVPLGAGRDARRRRARARRCARVGRRLRRGVR